MYLILIIHGIGANLETQRGYDKSMNDNFKKIIEGGYHDSKYDIITHVVDWKTEIEKSGRFGRRLKRVTIPSDWTGPKKWFDNTVPDCLAYLNPRFRPRILETITHQMNMIVTKMAQDEPRFKGKISLVTHSLGTVVTYDLLTRQKWENFNRETDDMFFQNTEKIRCGSGSMHQAAAKV